MCQRWHPIDYDVLPEEFLRGTVRGFTDTTVLGQWMPKAVKKDMNRLTQYKLDIGGANNLLFLTAGFSIKTADISAEETKVSAIAGQPTAA